MKEEELKMEKKISWDDATTNGAYVKLEEDKVKILLVTNHRLSVRDESAKIAAGKIEFKADVLEEDTKQVKNEKSFDTTSIRLLKKLRLIFEKKKSSDKTLLKILMLGSAFDTQYSVQEIETK